MDKKWLVLIGVGVLVLAVGLYYYGDSVGLSPGLSSSAEDYCSDGVGEVVPFFADKSNSGNDCPDEYEKNCWKNGFTCCNPETHVSCKGGICCPGNSKEDNCGFVDPAGGDNSFGFCKVTKKQCTAQNLKRCSGRFPAGEKSICCPLDADCGHAVNGIPKCVYDNGCPDGKFECGGGQCCSEGGEVCKPLKPGDASTLACQDDPGECNPPSIPCSATGDKWSNFACCASGQECTHDVSGYARCQGVPDNPSE